MASPPTALNRAETGSVGLSGAQSTSFAFLNKTALELALISNAHEDAEAVVKRAEVFRAFLTGTAD